MTEHDPSELTFTGLSDDKSTVLLTDESGATYTVAVTPALRAALPRTPAPSGRTPTKVETPMEPMASTLRPRDIQSRIRAGESPEAVAAAAQTTVEKIMGFAMPVLAERAHVAQRAQRASLRRSASPHVHPQTHLGDAVSAVLRSRNIDPESVEWDAWRRDDGRWTLTASYGAGQSRTEASFLYDAAGR
ncbi:MAG: septation protein SepH, partial [Nocardioidaceae bacterium]